MKLVSVIIPVFNGEMHIKNCIEKILNQTYKNIEVLVINDGSTDNTKNIIEQIQDTRLNVINKENSGVSDTRNYGILKSKGDYIIFLDSDDALKNDAIETMISNIQKQNDHVDMILYGFKVCGATNRYNDTEILRKLKKIDNVKNELIKRMISINENIYGYVWRAMYSKKLLITNNIIFPKEIKISEDYMFLLNAIQQSNTILIDDTEYYSYIINETSMSIKHIPTLLHDMLYVNNWMYNEIVVKDKNLLEGYNSCMCNTYLRFVQTTVRNSNKNLMVKIKEVYSEKKKNEFMKYFKSFRYSFKKYNKKTVISFILFRLNLEWLYMLLFTIKVKRKEVEK